MKKPIFMAALYFGLVLSQNCVAGPLIWRSAKTMEKGQFITMGSFSYKLLNYLIQGSAADQTKQCLCDWYEDYRVSSDTIYLATVHDEINISVPEDMAEEEMEALKAAMNQDLFDVPMRSEGFVGENWQELWEVD